MKNDWCKALEQVISKDADVVPEGWQTMPQIAKQMKTSGGYAYTVVKRLMADKKVAVKRFNVRQARRVSSVPHYKLL